MRILFILTQDMESPLGAGRIFPLAKALHQLGHEVHIAALHGNYFALAQKKINMDGVQIHYVAPMHVLKQGNEKRYYSPPMLVGIALWGTLALSWAAIRARAEIIHICKPHPMNSLAGLLAGWLRRTTVVVDCDDYEAGSGHFKGAWQKKVVAFFERNVPRQVKGVTTNTGFMREKLHNWGVPDARIVYLPNGIDPARFAPVSPETTIALREKMGLQGKKVVAFIGTVSLVTHPVNLLIEAFVKVVQTQPEAVLLLVGGGEDVGRLKRQANRLEIGEAVRMVGRVSPSEVPAYYAVADVSVDPVYADDAARGRLPLKLFESWACGVPFVSGDVGDRRLLLGEPPAGVLTDPGNPAALANAILDVIANPDWAAHLRGVGLERIKAYEWEPLARVLETCYTRLHHRKAS